MYNIYVHNEFARAICLVFCQMHTNRRWVLFLHHHTRITAIGAAAACGTVGCLSATAVVFLGRTNVLSGFIRGYIHFTVSAVNLMKCDLVGNRNGSQTMECRIPKAVCDLMVEWRYKFN